MTVETIQCELMLLKWSEDSANGGILRMQVDDLGPFKGLTEAKGKRAGQRFMAVLALIGDDEKAEPLRAGPLCKLAAIWCRETAFQTWLSRTWPSLWQEYRSPDHEEVPLEGAAKGVVCRICGVDSRKQLDHNAEARRAFNDLIRAPYMEHLGKQP